MARILKKLASALRMHVLKRNTSISLMHGLPAVGRLTPSILAQQPVKVNDEKSTSLCPPRVADHSRGNFCSDCRVRASARILNAPFCRKRCRANSVYGQKAIRKPPWRKFAPLISWLLPSQNADLFVNRSLNRRQTNASRSWSRTSLAVIASALSAVCLQINEIEMCETNHCIKTIKREK